MGKIKKFTDINIKRIAGGKDPCRLVEEFIIRQGFDPEKCQKERTPETARWMVSLGGDEELEVLVEGIKRPAETTIYMVGIKVSLVGHYLVLSASLGAAGMTVEDLDYHFKLIAAQQVWFRDALADELGWEAMPRE